MKMKIVLVILASIICIQAIEVDEVLREWKKFQIYYQKTYKCPVEHRKRFSIFEANLNNIKKHNALFDEGQVSFRKGINHFADWSGEEFMKYVNNDLLEEVKIVGASFNKTEKFLIPSSVDWREKGAVTRVKNQGLCGACWAFSVTGTIEGQLAIVEGNLISLSDQNLVDCATNHNSGCAGGSITDGYNYVKQYGIESEADYPSRDTYVTDCHADPSKVVTKISDVVNIRSGDEEALQEAIAVNGPISIAIDATINLQLYSSGILDDGNCGTDQLNHAVLAVGYGTENGREYYIIKNSWGRYWGEAGYFRLARNKKNMCGVSTMASYAVI